ncbi:MAG TPA: sugar ABC transporter permease [Bacillota bacterium]|nr:sugar ABC transporter permease [Bacillota bacterium]
MSAEATTIPPRNGNERKYKWYRFQKASAPYIFILPGVVFYLMVTIVPMITGFWMSFHNWNIIRPTQPWVGLANYRKLFADPLFWTAMKNTLTYSIGVVPLQMILALLVALLLNTGIKGKKFFRLLYYLPVITPLSIAAVIWTWIYHPNLGIFNQIVKFIGLAPQDWLGDPAWAMFSVILVAIWSGIGYRMVVYLAALQGIPRSYYEAAEIDGAGSWDAFRYITFPLLRPTTLYILVTSVISSFQVFGLVNVLTGGGPLDATQVVVSYIFKRAFGDLQFGLAAAMSFVLFGIILIITLIQWKFLGKEVTYE